MSGGKWLRRPAFVFNVAVIWWSSVFSNLAGYSRFAAFSGPRNDLHGWGAFLISYFRTRMMRKGANGLWKPPPGQNCMYLCNHRSSADSFLDMWLTEGCAAPLARLAVFFSLPVLMSYVYLLKGIIFFKRQGIKDKEGFNNWIDQKLKTSPIPGILVFPEGHRNFSNSTSLPLKRGMLNYAYSRKMPVQVIISRGKEQVMNEREVRSLRGATIVTGFSEVIESGKFETFDKFMVELQRVWDALWQDIMVAPLSKDEIKPMQQEGAAQFAYPSTIRIQLFLHVLLSMALFATSVGLLGYACGAVLSLLPALASNVLVAIFALWLSSSLWVWVSTVAPAEV